MIRSETKRSGDVNAGSMGNRKECGHGLPGGDMGVTLRLRGIIREREI